MQEFNEIQEFLIFFFEGILISFIFDFFRGTRNTFKTSDILTNIEDFIFLSSASIIFIFSIIYLCKGTIRFYMFLGIVLGISVYALTLSKKCVIIITSCMRTFKSFFTFVLKILKKLGKFFKL